MLWREARRSRRVSRRREPEKLQDDAICRKRDIMALSDARELPPAFRATPAVLPHVENPIRRAGPAYSQCRAAQRGGRLARGRSWWRDGRSPHRCRRPGPFRLGHGEDRSRRGCWRRSSCACWPGASGRGRPDPSLALALDQAALDETCNRGARCRARETGARSKLPGAYAHTACRCDRGKGLSVVLCRLFSTAAC